MPRTNIPGPKRTVRREAHTFEPVDTHVSARSRRRWARTLDLDLPDSVTPVLLTVAVIRRPRKIHVVARTS
jgi:hypothetical protein